MSKRIDLTGAAALVGMFDESVPYQSSVDFPYGANAPQEVQDTQEQQDIHRLKKKNIRGQSPNFDDIATMPLAEYVRDVLAYTAKLNEEKEDGIWHSPLFEFARHCKSHPEITNMADDEAMQAVEAVMLSWNELPRYSDPWEYYFTLGEDGDAARLDFMTSWGAVRHIPFHDVLQNALRLGDQSPLEPAHNRGKLYKRFVSLAGWLQVLMGDKVIYLPTRKLDGLLGRDHSTVSRLRKLAVKDGLLTVVKKHTHRPGGRGEATEFRFAVERFDTLRDDQ